MDFTGLNNHLNSQVLNVLQTIIPGGRVVGPDYVAGSVFGGLGDSFKYNYKKFTGADFASDQRYGDIVSLYAGIQSCSMLDAAKQLSDMFGYHPVQDMPNFRHFKHGDPVAHWCYRDENGNPAFYMARYDTPDGKQFCPFSKNGHGWEMKSLVKNRPLYNLPALKSNPTSPVIVVEGEKCADALQSLVGPKYIVTTWSNGSKSVSKSDFCVLAGRRVLLWPDADQPGREAMRQIAERIIKTAESVKILDVDDQPEGWDVADFTGPSIVEFIKSRIRPYTATPQTASTPESRIVASLEVSDGSIISGSHAAAFTELGIAVKKSSGEPFCNTDNVCRVLEGHIKFKDSIWYDDFYHRIFSNLNGRIQEWSDVDDINLCNQLQRFMAMTTLNDTQVSKAIRSFAHKNTRNEPKQWLTELPATDYNPSEFLIKAVGCPDNDYTRSVSRILGISICARIMAPGCKHDTMVILEGEQGMKKSLFFEVLAGKKWYTQTTESVQSKDFYQCLSGKIIVEFAELHAFSNADVTKIKQMLSNNIDRYRNPYARTAEDHPRMSVFSGTTNESIYLKDSTGARRFLPIKTNEIDIKYVQDNREVFFSACLSLYRLGHDWWTVPASAIDEQEDRRIVDPWEERIGNYILHLDEISTNEIMDKCLHIPERDQNTAVQTKIGKIMSLLKWYKKRITVNNLRVWRYFREFNKVYVAPDSENVENYDFKD